jgi:hypothetical protein
MTSYRGNKPFLHLGKDKLRNDELNKIENNTRVKELYGSINRIVIPGVDQYSDVIDLSSSRLSHMQITGTTSHQNIEVLTFVSNDNITFYEDIKEIFLISGTNIGANIFIPFKYVKFLLIAGIGQPVTINMIWSVRE